MPLWLPPLLLAAFSATSASAADPFVVSRFSYSGYLNVWFTGATTVRTSEQRG
jgi:hypothetical protein